MASITRDGSKWRAFVYRHGIRATKVTPTKAAARAWALKKEAELDALKHSGGRTFDDLANAHLAYIPAARPAQGNACMQAGSWLSLLAHQHFNRAGAGGREETMRRCLHTGRHRERSEAIK